jgi:hypothetical protein
MDDAEPLTSGVSSFLSANGRSPYDAKPLDETKFRLSGV